jgi:hypothetical protein
VPKSKSKRSTYIPPKPPKPKPSPRWVPIVGLSLIGIGIVAIILTYVLGPNIIPGGNYTIIVGFVLMAVGLLFLSRWR